MLSKVLLTRVVLLVAGVAALWFAASIFPGLTTSRPELLPADVLAHSRGGIMTNVLTQSSCSDLDGDFSCTVLGAGAVCAACSTSTYTNTTAGSNGGYRDMGNIAYACGYNFTGKCTVGLVCNTAGGSNIAVCNSPPHIIVQAP